MDSHKIVKDLNTREFSTVLSDIQTFISSEKVDCSDMCSILLALYQAIKVPSHELKSEDNKAIIFDMIPSINLCVDYLKSNYLCTDLHKNKFFRILYHIVIAYREAELYHPALSCGKVLKSFLEETESDFEDRTTYIKNLSIMFWNDAVCIENNDNSADFNMALAMRETSIDFLFLDKSCIDKATGKINITLARFCQNNKDINTEKLGIFLQNMWSYLEKFNGSYDHKAYLFKILQNWYDILLKYLKDCTIMKHFLEWFQNLSKSCRKKEHKILNNCSGLSKLSIQFFILQECDLKFKKSCSNYVEFCKKYADWNECDVEILAISCKILYSSFERCFRPLKVSEDEKLLTFLQSNISSCLLLVCHCVNLFLDKSVQKYLTFPTNKLFSMCDALIHLFTMLLKREKSETEKKDLINEAENFVKFSFSKITVVIEADDSRKNVIGFAAYLTYFAVNLYNLGLYSESIYFFEVADEIYSMCSTIPEYKSEETQLTLWKLHKVFIHVCLMTGRSEKALQIIVKSLLIHENKTKDCFDLWRKVKKDAVRNAKEEIIPNIVSDFLQCVDVKINAEKEIFFLLEELKICKSERWNADKEVIAISKRILSLPCSNLTRAYILLEVLTMPSNISDEIAENLKKNLSEICMETINLYVDILDKNPDDYTSKLYLSIAYFWLYHNSLKKIHDIAEKEAQNILKPPSPKPVAGVQNDVEEENDTCDIQPVHPLVSISFESEMLKNLNLAIQLWDDISDSQWQDLSSITKEQNVLEIIQATAETFSTAVYDFKELKLWLLLRSVSVAVKSKFHELTADISLINLMVRLGYLNMASYFLKETEKSADNFSNNEFEIIEVKFQLAKSYYYLHVGKFDAGLQILQNIFTSSVLEKRFKSVKIMHATALLILSDYLGLPSNAFSNSDNVGYLLMNSPQASLMESVAICKALLKHFSEKQASFGNGFDWICFKPLLIKNLLKAHVHLGELYFKIGDPRLSRCFLQDALKLAESQILTYWSSKILIILSHVDLMCDNFKDCRVKISGLRYIIDEDSKGNCLEILNNLQAKYFDSHSAESFSPDSPDSLVLPTIPDIALPRYIKQTFMDKIDVMSSPLSKKHNKKGSRDFIECNFNNENFSMNLLQLEIVLLSYLLSRTEPNPKQSESILQKLLNYYNQIKNVNYLYNILSSIKLKDKDELNIRLQSKLEVLLYTSIHLQKLELHCMKNDASGAKETLQKVFSFLEKASSFSRQFYSNAYASLKYHDIRVTLCDFYKIPLNSSVTYFFCPSTKPSMHLKKKSKTENSVSNILPNTPVRKNFPKIVISECKVECQAPLKKNLLNSNIKRDLQSELSTPNSPYVVFSSSDEEENFESPFDSLSRASKTRSGSKKDAKAILKPKADKNSDVQYRIFTQKNNPLKVKTASDVWNLNLANTPKSGKENRKLRSARTIPKPTAVSKKKTRSVTSASSKSKIRSINKKGNNAVIFEDPSSSKLNELLKEKDLCTSPDRDLPIEYSRGSPLDKILGSTKFSNNFVDNSLKPAYSVDECSDSVFFSPAKCIKKSKVTSLEDLCKELSSLSITTSKISHIAAGNLEEIISELYELHLLIKNSMPYPLYGNICKLLGVLLLLKRDGSWNDEKLLHSSFFLSEAFSMTLRNTFLGNLAYYKEPEYLSERELTIKLLKSCDPNQSVESRMESFLQMLPENWTIIQISALHHQEYLAASDPLPCPTKLVISHCQKNSAPIIVSTDCSSDERFSSRFLSEFGAILEESHFTMLNKDSKSWWTTRSSLDTRMKELTKDMENIWLGCWKGLFLGIPQNEERIKQLNSVADSISKLAPCTNNKLLQILIDSIHLLSKNQVCAAVCYLWNCNHDEEVHNKLCKSLRHISADLPNTDRHPLILILDQSIQDLPWECLPILKDVPVTRMPSLSILYAKLALLKSGSVLEKGFDAYKAYYVLNPGGDLVHSQQYFQNKFENQLSWNGVIGAAPCVKDYISGLKDHEFFIYCGHGSGRKYFEGTSIDKLKLQSTSIIMGCSSGKLRRLGRVLEAHGIVLRLLLSGCPSITANLWDVTDKDIDRFTEKLLQSLVPNYDELQCKTYDVAKAVSLARSACKMRYLVGAAPVVYGFPVFAMKH